MHEIDGNNLNNSKQAHPNLINIPSQELSDHDQDSDNNWANNSYQKLPKTPELLDKGAIDS